jgi:hypothetical protein
VSTPLVYFIIFGVYTVYFTRPKNLLKHWLFVNMSFILHDQHLLQSIPRYSVIVMDNATFHRKARLRELADETECTILFLPPYSPDLNPIEKFWAWLKRKLREILSSFDCFDDAIVECFHFK